MIPSHNQLFSGPAVRCHIPFLAVKPHCSGQTFIPNYFTFCCLIYIEIYLCVFTFCVIFECTLLYCHLSYLLTYIFLLFELFENDNICVIWMNLEHN